MSERKKEKKEKYLDDLADDVEYPLRISDLAELLEISSWSVREFLRKQGVYRKLDRDKRGVKVTRELADRILGRASNPPEQVDELEYDYPMSWLAKKMDVCSRTVKRWLRRKEIVTYCRRDRRGIRIPRSICAMICRDIDIGEPSKQIQGRIMEAEQRKTEDRTGLSEPYELSDSEAETLSEVDEKIKRLIEKSPHIKYRFLVRRNKGAPTGFLGSFYDVNVDSFSGIKGYLLDHYGGGEYSLKIYERGVPQPEVLHYSIEGSPKIPENMLDSYRKKESEKIQQEIEKFEHKRIEKMQQEIEEFEQERNEQIGKLEQQRDEQKSQVEAHPILNAIEVLVESSFP